jgi:hypothetical protein
MTLAQIRNSIQNQRLELSRGQNFNHYCTAHAAAFIALLLPLIVLVDWLRDGQLDSVLTSLEILLFSAIWLLLAVLLYVHLYRIRALLEVHSPLGITEVRKLLTVLAEREGWSVQNNQKTFMLIKTRPGFSWNWGERITVLFPENGMWVNSICDPDATPAIYSSGRNERNKELVCKCLSGSHRSSAA